MLQYHPPVVAARGARRVGWGANTTWGCPGVQMPCGVGFGADASSGWRGVKCRRGHLDVRVRPDVRALALPFFCLKRGKVVQYMGSSGARMRTFV
jgi:hypothetical protein